MTTLLTSGPEESTVTRLLREVLAELAGDSAADPDVFIPGTPDEWAIESTRQLAVTYGVDLPRVHEAMRRLLDADSHACCALTLSGLGVHPSFLLRLAQEATRERMR